MFILGCVYNVNTDRLAVVRLIKLLNKDVIYVRVVQNMCNICTCMYMAKLYSFFFFACEIKLAIVFWTWRHIRKKLFINWRQFYDLSSAATIILFFESRSVEPLRAKTKGISVNKYTGSER